jgi:arsenite methyltransferase
VTVGKPAGSELVGGASDRAACCALAYGDPLVELLVGDSLHPGGRSTTEALLSSAGLLPGGRLLDAGCGLGASARLAASAYALRVDACDVSEVALERARQLGAGEGVAVRYRSGSVLSLPYPDATFDAALVECVLSTTDRARALAELYRVLRPDALLLISDMTAVQPSTDWPEPLASVLCLTGAWRAGELEATLRETGFAVEGAWDETEALSALVERIETRYRLLRSMAGDGALGAHVLRLADRLAIEPAAMDGLDTFVLARDAIRGGGVGYVAAIARRLSARADQSQVGG